MTSISDAVLICPGQGAQRAGGVADLADRLEDLPPLGRRAFETASTIVGCDLWQLGLSPDPDDEVALRMPSLLQPYLVAWAAAEYSQVSGVVGPMGFVTGHSSGLNSAIAISGAVELESTLHFAWKCGRNMDRDCVESPGGLLALVGAGRAAAEAIAAESGASLANHNAPDQTVIGGSFPAIRRAQERAPSHGCQAVELRVAGAFHTPSFQPSDQANRALIDALPIADRFTPIVGNRSGQIISDPAALRDELCAQYVRPVEWLSVLETLYGVGARRFITLGPGNVMAGLVRRYGKTTPDRIQIRRSAQLR
ncbi:MAG: ACP S-malonyltransferase [Chloroflexi bacterium]|nr:ACP S-malonyltransferase [Chloroflexota bacterium]MYF80511.1 ACP S-malonyltransferase [Chloroflexota bacterium]MYI05286.1 ACP S-malonyltransferase [Chloroflexota bacterium]